MEMDYAIKQEELYRQKGDPWANLDASHPRFHLTEQYFRVLMACLPASARRVVDMGCGNGKLVSMLAASDHEPIGVDTSETAIATARERFPGLRFELGDIRVWQPEGKVDAVLSTGSYYHLSLDDRRRVVRHVYAYLDPGGVLAIVYGLNQRLVGEPTHGYDLDVGAELFAVFEPYEQLSYMISDKPANQQSGWTIFVGRKI